MLVKRYSVEDKPDGWQPFGVDALDYRRRQVSEIIDAPYLVVWIQRTKTVSGEATLEKSPVLVSESITLRSNVRLSLQAVVVHAGEHVDYGHFVCYFKWTHSVWFLFNNPPNVPQCNLVSRIGTLEEAVEKGGNFDILTKGFLFFYA